jgi:integrase
VFADEEGEIRRPERFSWLWSETATWAREAIDVPPIRLHDLRHTHSTLMQGRGVASDASSSGWCEVGSQRLGRASAVATMTVFAHALPGSQRDATNLFAQLIREASGQ